MFPICGGRLLPIAACMHLARLAVPSGVLKACGHVGSVGCEAVCCVMRKAATPYTLA